MNHLRWREPLRGGILARGGRRRRAQRSGEVLRDTNTCSRKCCGALGRGRRSRALSSGTRARGWRSRAPRSGEQARGQPRDRSRRRCSGGLCKQTRGRKPQGEEARGSTAERQQGQLWRRERR